MDPESKAPIEPENGLAQNDGQPRKKSFMDLFVILFKVTAYIVVGIAIIALLGLGLCIGGGGF